MQSDLRGVSLSVTDNGLGIPAEGQLKAGMGLRTMTHRASVIGASIKIQRRPRGGTKVTCDLRRR